MELQEKTCTICAKTFPMTSEFWHKQKKGLGGLRSFCKTCANKRSQEYRKKPGYKEAHAKRARDWRKKNPEKQKEAQKRNYAKNGAKENAKRKWRYHNDPEYRAKKDAQDKIRKDKGCYRKEGFTDEEWEKHLEKRRNYNRKNNSGKKYYAKGKAEYSDAFIKARIVSNLKKMGLKVTNSEIPQELINLKRKELKLLHHVKKQKNSSSDRGSN